MAATEAVVDTSEQAEPATADTNVIDATAAEVATTTPNDGPNTLTRPTSAPTIAGGTPATDGSAAADAGDAAADSDAGVAPTAADIDTPADADTDTSPAPADAHADATAATETTAPALAADPNVADTTQGGGGDGTGDDGSDQYSDDSDVRNSPPPRLQMCPVNRRTLAKFNCLTIIARVGV